MPSSASKNQILAFMSPADLEALRPELKEISLRPRQVVNEAYEGIQQVIFPLDSMISVISSTSEGETTEIALIASDGIVGATALLGTNLLPYKSVVQLEGSALAVDLKFATQLFSHSNTFRSVVLGYVHLMLSQISQSSVCNRFHSAEERLAKWLLASMDRTAQPNFPYTHELVASMLGVRRATVTLLVGQFEKAGIILAQRASITVIDPQKLMEITCDCYSTIKGQLDVFFKNSA